MNAILIDTNCLISYVTDRNLSQQAVIARYIDDAIALKCELVIVSNVLTEFAYVLTKIYSLKPESVSAMLSDILKTPGIRFQEAYYPQTVLKFWPNRFPDYGDAVLAAAASAMKLPILTFDAAFRKQLEQVHIPVV